MALYTRRGDAGETDLVGGARAPKDALRVEVNGALDELIADLGVARALCVDLPELGDRLLDLQHRLSALCGWVAQPGAPFPGDRLGDATRRTLEREIDAADALTGPLRDFVMPGATLLEATLHRARTTCRRAERRAVTLLREEESDPLMIAFLNRLSDWLFAQSRVVAMRRDKAP
ncbi:MAG: cob(I)yrinic acid a,c-diamide adenosyltransferase [Myxococcales bacterium]|jgi:cob(I)alamin adenosyltransferase|nr:cob(I)yrinic acid a,c-diamide adenosyltransferase [Myxococcales bacterium]